MQLHFYYPYMHNYALLRVILLSILAILCFITRHFTIHTCNTITRHFTIHTCDTIALLHVKDVFANAFF